MRSIFEKYRALNSISVQIFIVLTALAIMGVSIFFFFSGIEHEHLADGVESSLVFTENEILSVFKATERFLISHSEAVRDILLKNENEVEVENENENENEDAVSAYMAKITVFLKKNQDMEGLLGTHGFFYSLNNKYIPVGELQKKSDKTLTPLETEWFKRADLARGKVAITAPYTSDYHSVSVITFSRLIFDDNGGPLGIVCLDLDFDEISKNAIISNFSENSYKFLFNDKLDMIAHPAFPNSPVEKIINIDKGLTNIIPDLEQGLNVSAYKMKNHRYEDCVVYIKGLNQGWRLGIVIPSKEYNENIIKIAVFIVIGMVLLAFLVCGILYNIYMAKTDSDKKIRQKNNFLATMSHEIRTPLNAILGMTEIQMQNSALSTTTNDAFVKINSSGNLLLNIINDILDLSKIESGKFELIPVKYEVASLINDVVQLTHIRYEGVPVEFVVETDENTPAALVGDELRIKQVLNHLLSNSFKYTKSGTVTLSTAAECVTRAGNVLVTLVFKIIDTGQGMTPKQVGNLFNEYTHFNMEANRTTEGAGLGMTVTRNLVEMMNGQINIKSAVGEGTTVTVRLPQKTPGIGVRDLIGKEMTESLKLFKEGNNIQLKKAQVNHEFMPYGSVLIVDDVETNLYVAKGLMAPYGLKIDLATSGFEAIEKVKNGVVYDIIFMDHMMPKLDGIETTRMIREAGYTHPVVALTANALAGQAEVFLKNGFDDFISKPIDIRQLNAVLVKLVRNKQTQDVIESAQKAKVEFDKKQAYARSSQKVDPQLAGIFIRDAEKSISVLEGVLKKNFNTESDMQLYIINVHAMKSALANIGETELSATALRLEHAGREKDLNLMSSETNIFLDTLRAVIWKIRPKDDDDLGVEDTKDALAFLRVKLTDIKNACDAYDKKAVKNILNELKEKTWSHKTKEVMNSIADHLLHSEFDEVSDVAESYINTLEI